MLTARASRRSSNAREGARLAWLTEGVAQLHLVTAPVETQPDTDATPETAEPKHAHIVKVGPGESAAAKVLEARIYGTPVEALCGFVWVPSRYQATARLSEVCDLDEAVAVMRDACHGA